MRKKVYLTKLPDGRIKIPTFFAEFMRNPRTKKRYSQSHLTRINQGERELSIDAAIQVLHLFRSYGHEVSLTDLLPYLRGLKVYLCPQKDSTPEADSARAK